MSWTAERDLGQESCTRDGAEAERKYGPLQLPLKGRKLFVLSLLYPLLHMVVLNESHGGLQLPQSIC